MSNTVQIKNIGNEPLAFVGFPLMQPGQSIEVSKEDAEKLLLNESVKMVEMKKVNGVSEGNFKGVEKD